MTISNIVLLLAVLAAGLLAGLFYGYSCSVSPGLGALPDAAYLSAMQSINRAIRNPVFFCSFMGALVLLPAAAVLHSGTARYGWLLAATVLYLIGPAAITFLGNIPLNNALDAFDLRTAAPEALYTLRKRFEAPWNSLHLLRTLAAVASFALTVIACLKPGNR